MEATGAVRRPGHYELVDTRTLVELLELAGGPSGDVALGLPVRITTRGEGDRVEIYRSLTIDPKEARRRRAHEG